ncbi:crotonase/enoyl-CoA hydratase family protein [Pseudonocardia xishanensis]|uniref:Crotonase/enoyl-CoA hydratase family protein n=1 Tax=Pseudonocardia xishanensis TaxID=630995 RepID=A0ABP8S075_9PSEU
MSVQTSVEANVLVVTIDRPEARNAIDGSVAAGIEEAIDRLEGSDELRAAVLTGAPPVFSAGADLKVVEQGRGSELSTPRGGFAGLTRRNRSKPVLAAVDGPALAGGAEVVLACDMVVASTAARFGLPEVKRCLVAAGGGLYNLPRRLPLNVAMEIALTGDPISAERAERLGLVNRLVEPGRALAEAVDLAGRIAINAPAAVRETRRVLLESLLVEEGAGQELADEALKTMFATDDFTEGVRAFIEKREPVWTGR